MEISREIRQSGWFPFYFCAAQTPAPASSLTQELIANMLGVRREGVTEGATKLLREGLIRYVRGHINILDRADLKKRSCECYQVVRREYDRLLPNQKAI